MSSTKEIVKMVLEYSQNIFNNTLEHAMKMDIELSQEDLISLSTNFHKDICNVLVHQITSDNHHVQD
jgi:hypothetical protein